MTISFLNGNSLITVNTARVIPMNSVLKLTHQKWCVLNSNKLYNNGILHY